MHEGGENQDPCGRGLLPAVLLCRRFGRRLPPLRPRLATARHCKRRLGGSIVGFADDEMKDSVRMRACAS